MMDLPCGKCIGCREAKAKAWALRCRLELQSHESAAFTTLTYNNEELPDTLQKRHLQLFLKRLRKRFKRQAANRNVRFFACGEYGEQTQRPHYHAILFGASEADAQTVQKAWPHGHADVRPATHASVNYVAGYTAKKYAKLEDLAEEQVDEETGEVYTHTNEKGNKYIYQPPFLQMSRRPGIGGEAGEKYKASWRKCAVIDSKTQSVPRFLNDKWKKAATPMDLEKLNDEKAEIRKQIVQTPKQREAAYHIAVKKQQLKAERRSAL